MWASVKVPSDSVPTTQSPKRDVGTIAPWPRLWLFVSHHHHAGLALSLSCLLRFLSTNPFSLSSMHTHAPHVLITTTMPSIPCVWCVLWGWTAPSTTVVVKHATHTLVDHCVDGSHHLTLHPPSTLTPFCALVTTNHHAIPLLQPQPSHRHKATVLIHCPLFCLTHTHMVWMACAFVAALTSCGVCGWHAHPITSSTHTQPQPLCLCPSPHHHSLVCVDGNTCHMAMPNHQPLTCMAWSSRFLHKCAQSSPLPSTLCVWWIGGWPVLVWPLV